MSTWVWLACGGALGTAGRYAVTQAVVGLGGNTVLGTLAANVSGSLLIGFVLTLLIEHAGGGASADLRIFLVTGILGGYTTFSTFAWDTTRLLREGALLRAVLNGFGSLCLGVLAVLVGIGCARLVLRA